MVQTTEGCMARGNIREGIVILGLGSPLLSCNHGCEGFVFGTEVLQSNDEGNIRGQTVVCTWKKR